MKRLICLFVVAAMISAAVFSLPAFAHTSPVNDGDTLQFNGASGSDVFGDLLNWNGVVFGDVNNIIDVEGTLAVGGSIGSERGLSVNGGAYGADPASTDEVALLVNGKAAINGYGNVWGQTVIGSADGNVYRLSNVTASATTNGQFVTADAAGFFADAESTAYAAKTALESLTANGVCESAYGTYTFVGDPDADVLVYNVDDSMFNSYLFDFTIAEGQTVVVNLTASEKITFRYGAVSVNGSMEPDVLRGYNRNIIFNVVNSAEIEMISSELYGILLAPASVLNGSNASVCGTSILNSLVGSNGFELHVGSNDSFVPAVALQTPADPEPADPTDPEPATPEVEGETVSIRIDVPLKMAVAFEDGTVYYGGEMKDVEVGHEYAFQMCSVNWDNGVYDEEGNGIAGTVVYRMKVVHQDEFNELVGEAANDPERYTVKGIDIIDNEAKTIIVNCDAEDAHLETDVNNFFMAYRFHFIGEDYDKKTGIANVVNNPLESLSVNLPLGSTVTCDAYIVGEYIDSVDLLVVNNSGEGAYEDEFLTSVNDYTWNY